VNALSNATAMLWIVVSVVILLVLGKLFGTKAVVAGCAAIVVIGVAAVIVGGVAVFHAITGSDSNPLGSTPGSATPTSAPAAFDLNTKHPTAAGAIATTKPKPTNNVDCNLKAFNGEAAGDQLRARNDPSRRSRASEEIAAIFAKCAVENEAGSERARDLQSAYLVLESAGGDAILAGERDRATTIGRRLLRLTGVVRSKYHPDPADFDAQSIEFEARQLIKCAPTGVWREPPGPEGFC
jgi:hypothetical protein